MSESIIPKREVRQGDPLSPMLFNIVIDKRLGVLPSEIGVRTGKRNFNALAFADDIIFFASTPAGVQQLLDISHEFLGKCGLYINTA